MEKWKELFEICKIQHPNWRKNTINDFIEFEKEWNQTHDFDTFITADKDKNVIPIIKHYNPLHLD